MAVSLAGYPEFVEGFKKIPGAISVTEAMAIVETTRFHLKVGGYALDLGSNAGKSSLAGGFGISLSGAENEGFLLVDLIYDPVGKWKEQYAYTADPEFRFKVHQRATRYLKSPGALFGEFSVKFMDRLLEQNHPFFHYVFIDTGEHIFEEVNAEMERVEKLTCPGGLVFLHDYKNQFHGVEQAAKIFIGKGTFEEIPIDWNHCRNLALMFGGEQGNDSWHMPGQDFPNYVGCLRRL